MDIPIAVHVSSGLVETHNFDDTDVILKARSLRNTLSILYQRLRQLHSDIGHTNEDIQHYKYVLEHLRGKWQGPNGEIASEISAADSKLAAQCSNLWKKCADVVAEMENEVKEMDPSVKEVHTALVDIRGRLQHLQKRDHTHAEVTTIVKELDAIESKAVKDGSVFVDVEAPIPGQALCMELLVHNYELARMCEASAHDVPIEVATVADKLRSIKNELRQLAGRKHHTSADLAHYQFLLTAIRAAEGEYEKEWTGTEAAALMADCFALLEDLEATSEEMPPDVAEVFDQLSLHKEELEAIISHTVPKPDAETLNKKREALDAIDNQRAQHGGVFGAAAGTQGKMLAPPGQISCARLLDECYGLLKQIEGGI